MSIYGTLLSFDDEHPDECGIWVEATDGSYNDAGTCTCGRPDSPLIYQGSHVLPSDTDPRGGNLEFAEIGGWITRDARDNGPNEDKPWPYLRFSAGPAPDSIVLTRDQVVQVYEGLGYWLERTK